jgi:hypothetical protein
MRTPCQRKRPAQSAQTSGAVQALRTVDRRNVSDGIGDFGALRASGSRPVTPSRQDQSRDQERQAVAAQPRCYDVRSISTRHRACAVCAICRGLADCGGESREAGKRRMELQPAVLHRGSVTSTKGMLLTSDAALSAVVTTRAVNLGVYWRGLRRGQAV